MTSRGTGRTSGRGGGRLAAILGLAASLVLVIVGGVFTFVGTLDYGDYTGRAEATVVERKVDLDYDRHNETTKRRHREDITVYVDYRAEGRAFEHVTLSGLNVDDHQEGDRVQVAFPPEDPEDVVTVASTEEGAFTVFSYIGVPLLVLGIVLAGVTVVLIVRRRRPARDGGPAAPPPYGPTPGSGPGSPPHYGPPSNGPYR